MPDDVGIMNNLPECTDTDIRNAYNEIGLLLKVELPPEPSAWQMTKTWFSKLWSSTDKVDGLTTR